MYQHILAPVDGSLLSASAVGQVVEFARVLGAKVTFCHVKPNESPADEARAIIGKSETAARGAGIDHQSVVLVNERPYEAILLTAEELHCDLIFMASHGQRGFLGLNLGSQTQRVLASSRIPVLVAAIERNNRLPIADRALAVYRDEHRSIAAVVRGLTNLMQVYTGEGILPDLSLLHAMLFYLETFPKSQHHPREEQCLFPKLRGKDEALDTLIGKLEAQHGDESRLLAEMGDALHCCYTGGRLAMVALSRLADQFAELTWSHMILEDKIILGHVQQFFSETDWQDVERGFAGNNSPSLGGRLGEGLHRLLVEIMNRAPQG